MEYDFDLGFWGNIASLYSAAKVHFENTTKEKRKRDPLFLNYYLDYVTQFYKDEIIDEQPCPGYTHLLDLSQGLPRVEYMKNPFRIKRDVTDEWRIQRDAAFKAWESSNSVTKKGSAVRMSFVDSDCVKIAEATYFDQGKSNLVLDYTTNNNARTLRQQLFWENKGKLPRLNDGRLANTVGIAAILFYKYNGKLLPYLTYRAPGQSYLPLGGIHCTASKVGPWPSRCGDQDFYNVFAIPMMDDIKKLTRVTEQDLGPSRLIPLAIAREWIRAGKPQIFFTGYIKLGRKELMERRREAVSEQSGSLHIEEKGAEHIEIELQDFKNLDKTFKKYYMSTECKASLAYLSKFFNEHKNRVLQEVS